MKKKFYSTTLSYIISFCFSALFLSAQTTTFTFFNSIVNYTIPAGVTKLAIVAKGAQGGG